MFTLSINAYLQKLYSFVTYIVMPSLCAYCKRLIKSDFIFCNQCVVHIKPIVSWQLPITKTKNITIHAVSNYNEPLRHLIMKKLHGNIAASYQLGLLVAQLPIIKSQEFDLIIPVPLHWTRFAIRGFNQAEEIAYVINEKTGKPVECLVTRVKKTAFQSALSSSERTANVSDAFCLVDNAFSYTGKRILIIDDLYTTGSTIKEMSKLLYSIKPASITAVVVSRVL